MWPSPNPRPLSTNPFLRAGVSWWKRPTRGSLPCPHAQASQSSQRSSRFHKPAVSRAALETATISPPCGSLQASFVRKSRRGSTGGRLHFLRSRSPTAETRRRERRQCRCESCREHHFLALQALTVMQRTFNPWKAGPCATICGAEATADRHPTFNRVCTSGSTIFLPGRLISRTPPFEGEHGGANPAPAANFRSVVK